MKSLCVALVALGLGCVLTGCHRQTAVPALTVAPAVAQQDDSEKPTPAVQAPQAPAAAPSPGDRGTKLVAELLKPSEEAFGLKGRAPQRKSGLASLEDPLVPLPPLSGGTPRPPESSAGKALRPGPVAEELPLSRYRNDPNAPHRPELPSLGTVRLPPIDLDAPVPLPILAVPQPDRAALTDPAPGLSAAAVLAEAIPLRTAPAPFVRLNLPDPFEHSQAIRLRNLFEEEPTPPITTPRTPVK